MKNKFILQTMLPIGYAMLTSGAGYAQTLHFKVTGDYKARTIIAFNEDGGQATVTDKVVLEFDKNTRTGKVVGSVKIVNFPSVLSELRNVETSCPPPTPKGPYEHVEITSAVDSGYGVVEMKGTRSYPEVALTAYCQGSWAKKTAKPKQVPVTEYLALIEGDEPTVFSIKLDSGWTWTYVSTRVGK